MYEKSAGKINVGEIDTYKAQGVYVSTHYCIKGPCHSVSHPRHSFYYLGCLKVKKKHYCKATLVTQYSLAHN